MVWALMLAVALAATATWWFVVPRIRLSDTEAPDFSTLVTGRSTLILALASLVITAVLHLLPVHLLPVWLPYLALGLPLIAIDLLTTWLPRVAHYLLLAGMGIGWLGVLIQAPPAGLSTALGGLGAFVVFYLVWRLGTGLGFGDVRLAVPVGMAAGGFGLTGWATALFLATVIGALWALIHALRRRARPELEPHFPYGPALWLGPVAQLLLTAG